MSSRRTSPRCVGGPEAVRTPRAVRAAVAAAFLCGCGSGFADDNPVPEAAESVRARSPHFEVVCHFPCASAADEALAAADLAWREATALFPAPDSGPPPARIRLYRTEAFRAVAAALTTDQLEDGAAFSSPQRRTAFVELVPPVSEQWLASAGLPAPTLRLIAHEAAHLTFYAASGGAPHLPDWLSEGAAQAVEGAVARELGLFPGTDDPRSAARTWRVYSLYRAGRMPSLAELLAERQNTAVTRSDYAVRALAFGFLQGREPALLDALMEAARRRIGSRDLPDTLAEIARGSLGGGGSVAALDSAFAAYYVGLAQSMRWLEVRGLPQGRPLSHAGLPGGRATVLARDPWRGGGIEIEGRLEIADGVRPSGPPHRGRARRGAVPLVPEPAAPEAPGAIGVLLAGGGDERFTVSFERSPGRVTARRERGRGGIVEASEELGATPADLPAAFEFEVAIRRADIGEGGVLEVRVDGARVLAAPVAGDGNGDWGVFAEPGAAGTWLRLEAAPPG